MVQWLGLSAFTAQGAGSIPGQGTKIPHAKRSGQKIKTNFKKKKKNERQSRLSTASDSFPLDCVAKGRQLRVSQGHAGAMDGLSGDRPNSSKGMIMAAPPGLSEIYGAQDMRRVDRWTERWTDRYSQIEMVESRWWLRE